MKKKLTGLAIILFIVILAFFINSLIERPLIKKEYLEYNVVSMAVVLNEFENSDWIFALNADKDIDSVTVEEQKKLFEEMTELVKDIRVKPRYTLKQPEGMLMGIHAGRDISVQLAMNKDGEEIFPWFYFGGNNNFSHFGNQYNLVKYKIVNEEEILERLEEILKIIE